jgi:alcohol dehydrogenase
LEFSGAPEAIEQALPLLGAGGRFVLAGATFPARPVALPAEQIVRSLLSIIGVYNYNPDDLKAALDFLDRTRACYPFKELIGRTFTLSEANAAFSYADKQRPPRVAVVPQFPS